jgi:NTP pyrophosphatase (non-canonical NTP hydrolase)
MLVLGRHPKQRRRAQPWRQSLQRTYGFPAMKFFSTYQSASKGFAIYPQQSAIEYVTLGLASEAGEVAGKIKKVLRDRQGDFTAEDVEAIGAELGDTLWYVAQLATELGLDLDQIATDNIQKLSDRQVRNVLKGSGDRR